MVTYTYFAKSGNAIKIGRATNVLRRIKGLQTTLPEELVLLGVAPESSFPEKQVHAMFAEYRLRGEWFTPGPALLAFIAKHATPLPPPEQTLVRPAGARLRTPGSFGDLIKGYRKREGLTQVEVANAVGVSRKWIVEMERGKSTVKIGLVLRVAAALDIPIGVVGA